MLLGDSVGNHFPCFPLRRNAFCSYLCHASNPYVIAALRGISKRIGFYTSTGFTNMMQNPARAATTTTITQLSHNKSISHNKRSAKCNHSFLKGKKTSHFLADGSGWLLVEHLEEQSSGSCQGLPGHVRGACQGHWDRRESITVVDVLSNSN